MSNKARTIIISIFIIILAINCIWSISDLCNTKDVYNLKISQAEELIVIEHRIADMIPVGKDYYYKVHDKNNNLYVVKAEKSWFEKNFKSSGKAKNGDVEIKGLAMQINEHEIESQVYIKLTGNLADKDKIKCIDTKYVKNSIIKLVFGIVFIIICIVGIFKNKKLEKKELEQKNKLNNENQKISNPINLDVKPNFNNESESKELNNFDKEKLEKVVSAVKKYTARDSYSIELIKEKTSIFDSKFGGIPYWDLSKDYPVDKNGDKLILLAQINFEKENLESDKLPNTGMLQFFVENKFNCSYKEVNKVIYHENIDKNITEDDVKRLNVPTTLDSEIDITIKDEYKLSFKKVKESISFNDYRFDEVLEKAYNKLYETNDYNEVREEWDDEAIITDMFSDGEGHKLLGFPHFCQEDPRSAVKYNASKSDVKLATSVDNNKTMSWFPSASDMNKIKEENEKQKEFPNYNTLLLQIDSCDEFMWGDGGQVNIFINSKDLKNLNFDKVLWNFDCY